MTPGPEMEQVLRRFVEQFNASSQLPQMTRGWNRAIQLEPADGPWVLGLRVEGGRMVLLPAGVRPERPEIVLRAPSDLLAAIFRGETSPTEPYLDGTLVVQSSEEDMMKLDIFTLMVWGE